MTNERGACESHDSKFLVQILFNPSSGAKNSGTGKKECMAH